MRDLSFSRFIQLRKLLIEVRRDETHEKFVLSAFTAWQIGAGAGKKFGEYLQEVGLSEQTGSTDKTDSTPESKKLTAEAAIKKAEEILNMARGKNKAQ